MKKPIVYIDMDGVLADFKSALTKISPELIDEFAGQHDNIPGIFLVGLFVLEVLNFPIGNLYLMSYYR